MHNVRYEHAHENTVKTGLFHVDSNGQSETFTTRLFFNVFWMYLRLLVIKTLLLAYKLNLTLNLHFDTEIYPQVGGRLRQ